MLNRLVFGLRFDEMLMYFLFPRCLVGALGERGSEVFVCLVRHFRGLRPFVIVGSFVLSSVVGGVATMGARDRG